MLLAQGEQSERKARLSRALHHHLPLQLLPLPGAGGFLMQAPGPLHLLFNMHVKYEHHLSDESLRAHPDWLLVRWFSLPGSAGSTLS